MIFESIKLHNLFSYCGPVDFDLRGAEPGRNVVLISGRNGFGKTSFLNALRLLFCGVTNPMREAVQRQRTPTEKQYVLGAGEDWWGILNRRARQAGERECSVCVVWREGKGRVTARRTWSIRDNDYDTSLTIEADFLPAKLQDEAAQGFIGERLPADFVPFFIFDGEQIQELAEANRATQIEHIERLLNISGLNLLADALWDIRRDMQNQSMDAEQKARLVDLQGQLANQGALIAATRQELADVDEALDQIDRKARTVRKRLESRRAFIHRDNEEQLKGRHRDHEKTRADLAASLVDVLPRVAPILVNGGLAEAAAHLLEAHAHPAAGNQHAFLERLLKELPQQVFAATPPPPVPPLLPEQQGYYRNRLAKLIEAEMPAMPPSTSGVLDVPNAERAQRVLRRYGDNQELRQTLARQLEQLFRLRGEIARLREEIANTGALSASERELYERDARELDDLDDERVRFQVRKNELEKALKSAEEESGRLADEIKRQENAVKVAAELRRKAEIASQLRRFIDDYKQRLKDARRADLETAINRHFSTLMTSHSLIAHIHVDEEFGLHYQDAEGRPVGMGNLSAGMKQLAATALLWALKACSGQTLPIVVDTPLARIDRGNQENLLRSYYPVVSEQVIVLPTDSEIDEAKYRLIQPHVYREFTLHNLTGDATEVTSDPMYRLVGAAHA